MNKRFFTVIAVTIFLLLNLHARAAETNDDSGEIKALVAAVQVKIQAGERSETNFSDELKQFDVLTAKHKNEKTDAAAEIPYMKAMLYIEVFADKDKGAAMIEQIKKDYPDTKYGQHADAILASIAKQEASKKIQSNFIVGSKFPDFDEKDVAGKPLSIANYKGKVVLVDFWATWCGPCVGELPNVLKTYAAHHAQGFEIIGVSLDEDQPKLENFIKENNVTWQQFFDGKGWGNKLAVKYGIESIPSTFLLDGSGNIIGKDLRGEELEAAVTKALANK
jgi:peroxiredoxin